MHAAVIAGATVSALGLGIGLAVASGTAAAPPRPTDQASAQAAIAPWSSVPQGGSPVGAPSAGAAPAPEPVPTATPEPGPVAEVGTPARGQATAASVDPTPGTSSGSDGSLAATLSASPSDPTAGTPVSFVVSVSDTAATGPVGPSSLTYGDGQPAPETGLAASCRAGTTPSPVTAESFDYTHAYGAPGIYTVTVAVSAPCSSERVLVTLPVTVGG